MKYSIIIPTYNHCEDLLKPCLESIFKYTDMTEVELIVSANGCVDSTGPYLESLRLKFLELGFEKNFKVLWDEKPIGYSKANNAGIRVSTGSKLLLLNNDILLLPQAKNKWLELLEEQFTVDSKCGISCVLKNYSEWSNTRFAVFFCVMIDRKVFDRIGLLNEEYGKGGGEDTEFCVEAERAGFTVNQAGAQTWSDEVMLYTGDFPIFHRGEGTVHDITLVPDWSDVFYRNSLKLAKKYRPDYYRFKLTNNYERAVFLKGDPVFSRENARYTWAAENLIGSKVLELGCTTGYGLQYLPQHIEYTGIDYDSVIIDVAREQNWERNATFINADINAFNFEKYDTIIAFEVIEHLDNGLVIAEELKKHCTQLLLTVPLNEEQGFFGHHHKLFHLTEEYFPGYEYSYIDEYGNVTSEPPAINDKNHFALLLCKWVDPSYKDYKKDLAFIKEKHNEIYGEVIKTDCYNITTKNQMVNRNVIDIGANIGSFSLLAAYLGAKKVVCVEPISETFNYMLGYIEQSKLTNILPIQRFVSYKTGDKIKVSINENSGHNSAFNVGIETDKFEEIETITFTDILSNIEGDNIFLKLDCEGGEYEVILNATNEEMSRVSQIAMEIHTDLHPKYKGSEVIELKLKSCGFTMDRCDQVYSWDYAPNGERVNWKKIPFVQQLWSRHE